MRGAAIAGCLLVAACDLAPAVNPLRSDAAPDRVSGRIDRDFALEVASTLEEHGSVEIASQGGLNSTALTLAEFLAPQSEQVTLSEYCLSACASYLFTSLPSATIRRDLVLGFHHDDIITRGVYKGSRHDGMPESCYSRLAGRQTRLILSAGFSPGFSIEVGRRLNPLNVRFVEAIGDSDCQKMEYDFEIGWWFPTSAQIEQYLGRPLAEPLCADSMRCMRRELRRWGYVGTIMIGDGLFRFEQGRMEAVAGPHYRTRSPSTRSSPRIGLLARLAGPAATSAREPMLHHHPRQLRPHAAVPVAVHLEVRRVKRVLREKVEHDAFGRRPLRLHEIEDVGVAARPA